MRFGSAAATLVMALATLLPLDRARAANCAPSNITLLSATPATFGTYSPYLPAPLSVTFVVTIATNANCTNLYFGMTAASAWFAPSAPTLSYTILGTTPTPAAPDKVNAQNTTVTLAYTARLATGQLAPAGLHSSAAGAPIRLEVYLRDRGDIVTPAVRSIPLDASVFVAAGCDLPPASQSTVDFTAALTTGLPNPGIVRTVRFTGASCVSPARIRLSGSALQPSAPMSVRPGFDNRIDWSAAATFGLASTTLTTNGVQPSAATSVNKNSNGAGPTTGNIDVSINLQPGTRPQAGTYSGILTVSIDPLY